MIPNKILPPPKSFQQQTELQHFHTQKLSLVGGTPTYHCGSAERIKKQLVFNPSIHISAKHLLMGCLSQ